MNLIKCLDRLFFGKRAYMTNVKPCPCCGGRHIRFKTVRGFLNINRFVCDDCGFEIENFYAEYLLTDWEKIPRPKEDNHDSHAD